MGIGLSASQHACLTYATFPQDHYDWGLRAIKSVLVVAGSLKRGDPDRPEDQVLMRSLRDFNIPKIVTDDIPVFMGLIGDLFPALDVPRRRDLNFEALARKAVMDLKLQAEDNFVLKVHRGFPSQDFLCLFLLFLNDGSSLIQRGALDAQIRIYLGIIHFRSSLLGCPRCRMCGGERKGKMAPRPSESSLSHRGLSPSPVRSSTCSYPVNYFRQD